MASNSEMLYDRWRTPRGEVLRCKIIDAIENALPLEVMFPKGFLDVVFDKDLFDLRGIYLQGVKGIGACLQYVSLDYAVLDFADLSGADLQFSSLNHASFKGVHAPSAFLIGVTAKQSAFVDADLEAAVLSSSDFAQADFSNARLLRCDCSRSNFTDCLFAAADLRESDFHASNLKSVDLSRTNLSGVNFEYARMENTLLDSQFPTDAEP